MAASAVSPSTVQTIQTMDEDCVRNLNSGNAEAFVSAFYTQDAELFPPNGPLASGHPAILEFWKGMVSLGLHVAVLETKRVDESGDLAYGSGVYDLTLSPPGAGTITDKGKYVVVYRRQPDRTWKAIADIFNSSQPAAPETKETPHPVAAILREAYAAFGRGDVEGYLRPCTDDFAFNVPGHGGIAGAYRGKQGLYELARRAMEITGGSFQEEVEDVLANDDRAVVLARHRFTRDAQQKDYRTVHVYEIRDGKLAQCWEQPRDQTVFDEAWGPAR